MIKVEIKKDRISISGHSGYEESGKDIVCASVSSMVITSVNAIIRLKPDSIEYDDTNGMIINILQHSNIVDILIENLIDLLNKLEKQYPKYIKIGRCSLC